MSKQNLLVFGFCVAFMIIAFWDIAAFIDNSRRGFLLFATNVLPVLFPFFFISSLLIELNIFRNNKGAKFGVVVMSFLSGYPTGARMLSDLYTRGQITRTQAIKTATYTSTTSPIFVIATVGVALYGDVKLGVLIFMAHVMGALLNGLLYTKCRFTNHPVTAAPCHPSKEGNLSDVVSQALHTSVQSILGVGGLIVMFLIAAAPFGLIGSALLEMTTAIFHASNMSTGGMWRAVIPCAIVSFGGLCVAVQGFVFMRAFDLPVWFYFLYKTTHTLLAVGCCAVLVLLF